MVKMLVTRPTPEASETAARLSALDIDAVVEPLLVMNVLPTGLPRAEGFAALAVTSGNALRALHERGELPRFLNLPVYTVGDRTAELARGYGFAEVVSARGNLQALVTLLAQAGIGGPVLYPAAREQAGDLARALAPHGVMAITTAVYEMVPASRLSETTLGELANGAIAAALFYSRRTAEAFIALTGGLRDKEKLAMLCLSEAVAAPLLAAHFVRVGLADHPSEEAMLGLALSFARDRSGMR